MEIVLCGVKENEDRWSYLLEKKLNVLLDPLSGVFCKRLLLIFKGHFLQFISNTNVRTLLSSESLSVSFIYLDSQDQVNGARPFFICVAIFEESL